MLRLGGTHSKVVIEMMVYRQAFVPAVKMLIRKPCLTLGAWVLAPDSATPALKTLGGCGDGAGSWIPSTHLGDLN